MGFISHDTFNSFTETVQDQSVVDMPVGTTKGFIFITGCGHEEFGVAWFRASASASVKIIFSETSFDVAVGVGTGTSGSDGNITLFVSNGRLQIENRTGSEQLIQVTVLG